MFLLCLVWLPFSCAALWLARLLKKSEPRRHAIGIVRVYLSILLLCWNAVPRMRWSCRGRRQRRETRLVFTLCFDATSQPPLCSSPLILRFSLDLTASLPLPLFPLTNHQDVSNSQGKGHRFVDQTGPGPVCPGRSGQIFDQHRKQISFSFGRLTESEKLEMQPENKIADQA